MRLEPCQVYAVGVDGLVSALTDPKSSSLSAHDVDDEDRNVTDGIEDIDSRNQ